MVALIPFILSLMGFGFGPKVLVVFLFAVFPILYNTVEGARSIKPELIEVARSFRSSEWALWREVMLPYTLPFTMTGVRQAIGRGLVGMVAAEFFLSSTGLGQLIMTASQNFDTAGVFAMILVIGLIGVGADARRADDRASISRAGGSEPMSRARTPALRPARRPALARHAGAAARAGLVDPAGMGRRRCARFAPAYVAKPSGVIVAIPKVIVDPAFLNATAVTLLAVAEGLAIALVLGTLIGLLIGRSVVAERALRHYVNGFYAVPMIIVLPLLSLWFGYTGAARLATVVFAAVFSIIVNVADGAKSVPREYLEVARSFRSGRLRVMIEIVLPAATPYFLAGLRLAAGRALIGAVVAEFFTAIGGLGYFILYQSRTYPPQRGVRRRAAARRVRRRRSKCWSIGARGGSCPGTAATNARE